VGALLLPDLHMNTIQFAQRWVPGAGVLLVLAAPMAQLEPRLRRGVALGLAAFLSLSTTLAWRRFEHTEMTGFATALAALPRAPRVIGLDYVQESRFVQGRPFMQDFAYAQVLKGGRLNMSFAGFAPSLVVFKEGKPMPWTPSLEWAPERLRPADFQYFDFALINGDEATHAHFATLSEIEPVTHDGRWRLYRVKEPKP